MKLCIILFLVFVVFSVTNVTCIPVRNLQVDKNLSNVGEEEFPESNAADFHSVENHKDEVAKATIIEKMLKFNRKSNTDKTTDSVDAKAINFNGRTFRKLKKVVSHSRQRRGVVDISFTRHRKHHRTKNARQYYLAQLLQQITGKHIG